MMAAAAVNKDAGGVSEIQYPAEGQESSPSHKSGNESAVDDAAYADDYETERVEKVYRYVPVMLLRS